MRSDTSRSTQQKHLIKVKIITSININIRYCSYYKYLKLKLKASLMRPNVSKSQLFLLIKCNISSVQFSRSVMSDFLWPHGLQHARLCCLPPTPGACSNWCPSSRWCHPTISSFVISFSSCLHCFWASGSFPMSQSFTSGGQNIGASASALPKKYSGLISFRIAWFDLLADQGTLMSLLQHHSLKSDLLRFKC